MVRDQHGKKMSKSFGNAVDPLDWIDRFGADALRFTLARGANPGTDVPVSEEWVPGLPQLLQQAVERHPVRADQRRAPSGPLPAAAELSSRGPLDPVPADSDVIAEVDAYYEDFEFAKASDALYHFVWDDVCDWYVELAKPPLAAGGAAAERTRRVLGHVLDTVLRLLHPVIPFVTEELWTALTGEESVVIAAWPAADESLADARGRDAVDALQTVGHRGPPVPRRPGPAAAAAGGGTARPDPPEDPRTPTSRDPLADPAGRAGGRVRAHGVAARRSRPRSSSTCPARSTSTPSGGGLEKDLAAARKELPDRDEARQRGVRRQGARAVVAKIRGAASGRGGRHLRDSRPGSPHLAADEHQVQAALTAAAVSGEQYDR